MTFKKQFIGFLPLSVVVIGLLGYNFLSAQWQNPTATAPGNNTEAPINISANYQAKLGDLGAVRMRAGEYCDATGLDCFTADEVGGGGGGNGSMADFYTYMTNNNPQAYPEGTACSCQTGELLTGCSGFQNGDNDTQQLSGGRNGCFSDGSTRAQCHCMGAEPRNFSYAWSVGTYSCTAPNPFTCQTTYGTNVRTVVCKDQFGTTVADSLCPSPKPATSAGACSRKGPGSDC